MDNIFKITDLEIVGNSDYPTIHVVNITYSTQRFPNAYESVHLAIPKRLVQKIANVLKEEHG